MSTIPFIFKIASEDWEFEQIHRLNYTTFVEEIPQHAPNPSKSLVDKFHHQNTYIICTCGHRLAGMVALRDKRPFSLDEKLEHIDACLPPHRSLCELRLMAVDKHFRGPRVFQGLMDKLTQYIELHGYDLVVISGTIRQQKLYRHLGFTPFGPLVGTPEAQYQPMYLTLQTYKALQNRSDAFHLGYRNPKPINFLPGPVAISDMVQQSFRKPPISHRSMPFMQMFAQTKYLLCQLVGSRSVEIFMGSGTLANDVVAGQLSLLRKPGLILTNGEFGNRLVDHANGFGLSYQIIRADWGGTFDMQAMQRTLEENLEAGWLWAVHSETSTGILNDLSQLKKLARRFGYLLCIDCTSSLGTLAIDLSDVYLATSVSGKALGTFSGLAMVFYNHKVRPAAKWIPRYLDLGFYAACNGVPFTISSNLVYALNTALQFIGPKRFNEIATISSDLRSRLANLGFQLVGTNKNTSPAVITIALPDMVESEMIGDQLKQAGYLVSYRSGYLLKRNWIQICLMGEINRETIDPFVELLSLLCLVPKEQLALS